MNRDDAHKLCEDSLAELANQLDSGQSDELKRFLDAVSTFHRYSYGNCLLIVNQRPTATLVAGFHAWRKRGRTVKKGERGICILAPMLRRDDDDEEGETKVRGYRAVHVFDIEQTEGCELPELNRVSGDADDLFVQLATATGSLGVDIVIEDDLGGADGVSRGGEVAILRELSPAAKFATLAHELAHELLHKRKTHEGFPKRVKELEAESVAYVVCRWAGLDNALLQAADYIQCHRGDSALLAQSLDRIQKTAATIIDSLMRMVEVWEAAPNETETA